MVGKCYNNGATAWLELEPVVKSLADVKDAAEGSFTINGWKWWDRENPRDGKDYKVKLFWTNTGELTLDGQEKQAAPTPVDYNNAPDKNAPRDAKRLAQGENPQFPVPRQVGSYDVLATGFGKELGGRKLRFHRILTIFDQPAPGSGTLRLQDQIGGYRASDGTAGNDQYEDTNMPLLYVEERLELYMDKDGEKERSWAHLVFDYEPEADAGPKSDYAWRISTAKDGAEKDHGDFGASPVVRELPVEDSKRIYLLQSWYKRDPTKVERTRTIEFRIIGIIPYGIADNITNWAKGETVHPDRQQLLKRFAFHKNGAKGGGSGMDVFYRIDYGTDTDLKQQKLVGNVTWVVDPMPGLQTKFWPDPANGPDGGEVQGKHSYVEIRFYDDSGIHKGYPQKIASLGRKPLTVKIKDPARNQEWSWTKSWWAYVNPGSKAQLSEVVGQTDQNRGIRAWYYFFSTEAGGVCNYSMTPGGATFIKEKITAAGFERAAGRYDATGDQVEFNEQLHLVTVWRAFDSRAKQYRPGNSYRFTWESKTRCDTVNIIAEHERTHQKSFKSSTAQNDRDRRPDGLFGDKVPDVWEADMRLSNNTTDTFGFSILKGERGEGEAPPIQAYPDNEFYAWINAAFSADFSGKVLDGATDVTQTLKAKYQGIVPSAAQNDLDWSVQGYRWDRGEGR